MKDALGLGVVGAGSISLRGILPHLSMEDVQDRVRLVAVCDPVPDRAAAAAEKFGIAKAYTSYKDLLNDPSVDAVTIASPIGLHYQQGRLALLAGKHVQFNKTMATSVAEVKDLIDLADASGLKMVPSPGVVLLPHVQRTKELIMSGAIGTLTWASGGASVGDYHLKEKVRTGVTVLEDVNPAWYYRKPGGGPLYDATIYWFHYFTTVLGPAKSVVAMSGQRVHELEFRGQTLLCDADDSTLIIIEYGDGLFVFAYGTAAGGVGGRSFFGTEGIITEDKLNGEPFDFPGRDLSNTSPYGPWSVLPHVVGQHRFMEEMGIFEDNMQLVDWVREGKPSAVTVAQALHVIEIIEAAYRSAATGARQVLETTF